MDRDMNMDDLAAADEAASVRRWAARGAADGARHYPSTDHEARQLAEQLYDQELMGKQQASAAELQAKLAATLADTGVHALSIEDVQGAVLVKVAGGAAEMASVVPAARARLAEARSSARQAAERLTRFQQDHDGELKGRAPLPQESWWKRLWLSARRGATVVLTFAAEAGGFVALGVAFWREALSLGLIGGGISAALLWSLGSVLRNSHARWALGANRARAVAWMIALAHLLFAYTLAVLRDGLEEINNHRASGIGELLVPPWALSPESALVVALAAVLLLATWLGAVGRAPFAHEEDYRRMWAALAEAEAAVSASKLDPLNTITDIAERISADVKGLQAERDEVHSRCRQLFGAAHRAVLLNNMTLSHARSLAARCWQAYAEANARARAPGNPPPRSLLAPLPLAPTLDFEHRDLLEPFAAATRHALDLARKSQEAATTALHALCLYASGLRGHLERVLDDPGLDEAPPRWDVALRQALGPAFTRAKRDEGEDSDGDVLRDFFDL